MLIDALTIIIFAAGKGTRLYPKTTRTPKPLLPVCNRPFIFYTLSKLQKISTTLKILITYSYERRLFENTFKRYFPNLDIRLVYAPAKGHGYSLHKAYKYIKTPYVLGINGDVFIPKIPQIIKRLLAEPKDQLLARKSNNCNMLFNSRTKELLGIVFRKRKILLYKYECSTNTTYSCGEYLGLSFLKRKTIETAINKISTSAFKKGWYFFGEQDFIDTLYKAGLPLKVNILPSPLSENYTFNTLEEYNKIKAQLCQDRTK